MAVHPEKRGDRNPLTARKLRRNLMKNRFVPKKKEAGKQGGDQGVAGKNQAELQKKPSDSLQP